MRLVKTSAEGLDGRNVASARIRERTGCSLVVIERDEKLFTDFDRDFEIHRGDSIYLCGSEEAVERYFEIFPEARSASARSAASASSRSTESPV
jgi:K+/H+ antiporter YhaU regulatory subunit KhtT